MPRRRAGRPPKYNDAIHEAICKNLEAGMSRTTAAELAKIDRGTLEDWRERYPAFDHDVRESIAKAKARATVTITKAIQKGDVQAAFRYLALQEKEEWQPDKATTSVNVTVSVEVRQQAERLAERLGITPEELLADAEKVAAEQWEKVSG